MSDGARIQATVEAAAEARREHERLSRRLVEADERVSGLQAEVERGRGRLAEEAADVERLESYSPGRIWASLKGSRAGDLEREKAEREAARYAVAESEARLAAAQADRDQLRARLSELGDVDRLVTDALRAKEEWATAADPALAERLTDLSTRRGELVARDQQLREAFEAGRAAGEHLTHAAALLGNAGSWATWDTFGGGMFADMMKYDKLDQATSVLRAADHALRAFGRELTDVGAAAVPTVQVDSMIRTFDVFFDNVFSDMAVRGRINRTAAEVDRARAAVDSALESISRRGYEIAQEVAAIDAERERLLA